MYDGQYFNAGDVYHTSRENCTQNQLKPLWWHRDFSHILVRVLALIFPYQCSQQGHMAVSGDILGCHN